MLLDLQPLLADTEPPLEPPATTRRRPSLIPRDHPNRRTPGHTLWIIPVALAGHGKPAATTTLSIPVEAAITDGRTDYGPYRSLLIAAEDALLLAIT